MLPWLPLGWEAAQPPRPASHALLTTTLLPAPCVPQVETPDFADEVLECPSLRHLLRPRPSPFVVRLYC